jgi:hypothetical protein
MSASSASNVPNGIQTLQTIQIFWTFERGAHGANWPHKLILSITPISPASCSLCHACLATDLSQPKLLPKQLLYIDWDGWWIVSIRFLFLHRTSLQRSQWLAQACSSSPLKGPFLSLLGSIHWCSGPAN